MRDDALRHQRAGERGAVSFGTLLGLLAVGALIFVVIKVFPVYTEERRVKYDVEELANKSAVRDTKTEEIQKKIEGIVADNGLPKGSINLLSQDRSAQGSKGVQIEVNYSRTIDLLVTSYVWKVNYRSLGRAL